MRKTTYTNWQNICAQVKILLTSVDLFINCQHLLHNRRFIVTHYCTEKMSLYARVIYSSGNSSNKYQYALKHEKTI